MLLEPVASQVVDPNPTLLPAQGGDTLLAAVQALSLELGAVRQDADPTTSARLAGAEDELAAIHDELRQQQEEIESLLTGDGFSPPVMMRRFLSALPLATILTDSAGMILEANPAAHTMLRVAVTGLPGKPIFSYLVPEDRRRVRSVLSRAAAGSDDELVQIRAAVAPRLGPALPSRLALACDLGTQLIDGGATGVFWVLMPDDEATGGLPSDQQLEALTRLCRLGADGSDLRTTLGRVVRLCLQALPEVSEVSLLVGNPLEPTLAIASSAEAQHLDGLQHARSAGPSFDAYRSRRPVALAGAAVTEHQGLARDARAVEVRSLLAIPLLENEQPTGVLTLYAATAKSAATLTALRQAMPFVEAAQSMIRDAQAHEEMLRTQEQLQAALTSRAVIDQAKGMIMVTLKCDAEEAFAHLVRMSSTRHEKVRHVAQTMVDEVLTPPGPPAVSPSI